MDLQARHVFFSRRAGWSQTISAEKDFEMTEEINECGFVGVPDNVRTY